MRKSVIFLIALLAVFAAVLSACGPAAGTTAAPTEAMTEAATTAPTEAMTEAAPTEAATAEATEAGGPVDTSVRVAAVLDTGGENDRSFNEYTLKGAREAADELGLDFSYVVSESTADY